jgi:hypothetical protein
MGLVPKRELLAGKKRKRGVTRLFGFRIRAIVSANVGGRLLMDPIAPLLQQKLLEVAK